MKSGASKRVDANLTKVIESLEFEINNLLNQLYSKTLINDQERGDFYLKIELAKSQSKDSLKDLTEIRVSLQALQLQREKERAIQECMRWVHLAAEFKEDPQQFILENEAFFKDVLSDKKLYASEELEAVKQAIVEEFKQLRGNPSEKDLASFIAEQDHLLNTRKHLKARGEVTTFDIEKMTNALKDFVSKRIDLIKSIDPLIMEAEATVSLFTDKTLEARLTKIINETIEKACASEEKVDTDKISAFIKELNAQRSQKREEPFRPEDKQERDKVIEDCGKLVTALRKLNALDPKKDPKKHYSTIYFYTINLFEAKEHRQELEKELATAQKKQSNTSQSTVVVHRMVPGRR